MTNIIACTLDVRKCANQTQLKKTIEKLKDVAVEVMDFIEGCDSSNRPGVSFLVIIVATN